MNLMKNKRNKTSGERKGIDSYEKKKTGKENYTEEMIIYINICMGS